MAQKQSFQMLAEIELFAGFNAAEQRYIRRSLDVGLNRGNPLARWARNLAEVAAIMAQARRYRSLDFVRACLLDEDETETFLGTLVAVTSADLAEGRVGGFEAYAFLYERLIGPGVRPWLVSAFSAAASLPALHPAKRKVLTESVPAHHVMAAGWSIREPVFYPEWVEMEPEAVT